MVLTQTDLSHVHFAGNKLRIVHYCTCFHSFIWTIAHNPNRKTIGSIDKNRWERWTLTLNYQCIIPGINQSLTQTCNHTEKLTTSSSLLDNICRTSCHLVPQSDITNGDYFLQSSDDEGGKKYGIAKTVGMTICLAIHGEVDKVKTRPYEWCKMKVWVQRVINTNFWRQNY